VKMGDFIASRRATFVALGALAMTMLAPQALAYIHFPPMTRKEMCATSHQIRVLKIDKFDKEKGVVIFELAESFKKQETSITSFKHVIRTDAEGTKPILDWMEKGKTAVAFSIETRAGYATMGIAYVFIDNYCYSFDCNPKAKCWMLIRAEPGMSACYHGSVAQLRELVKQILDGKDVKVPVKEPDARQDAGKRRDEINEIFKKIR
jgi:hypothetical protein